MIKKARKEVTKVEMSKGQKESKIRKKGPKSAKRGIRWTKKLKNNIKRNQDTISFVGTSTNKTIFYPYHTHSSHLDLCLY